MAGIPCWQVDAFTDHAFGGNPAAVCWLEQEVETGWMQSVAAEMNLSETAFVRRLPDAMELRWFTPTIEVDLCGHATLATARALWTEGLAPKDQPLRFQTRSGMLTCRLNGELIELDFPATPPTQIAASQELLDALGVTPLYVGRSKFYQLAVVDSPETVRTLEPDFRKMIEVPTLGVIVSAASSSLPYDFESRFFAPRMGVDEAPVCGSAHCCLAPYWSEKLGKKKLLAYQASARGGILHLRWEGERVILAGQGVIVWRGEFFG